jgi:hypothetical protein
MHIPLFGILEIDVGNATEAVTHLCPTKVVLRACRHSNRPVLDRRSHQKLKIAKRSFM